MKDNLKKPVIVQLLCIIWILINLLLLLNWGNAKEGLFCDEAFSYSLSNSTSDSPFLQDSDDYEYNWHSADYFNNHLNVSKDNRFNIISVVKNQAADVHPPLYYWIMNGVCSIFVDNHSKWLGIGINLIFFIITEMGIHLLSRKVISDKVLQFMPAVLYGISLGGINTVLFIRMYMLLTCECIFLFLVVLGIIERDIELTKYYVGAYFLIAASTLTHYYFFIFLFFCAGMSLVMLLFEKKWEKAINLVACIFVGLLNALLIFPYMINHIFNGYRGKEAVDNLRSDYDINNVKELLSMFDDMLFGGFGVYIILVVLFCVLLVHRRHGLRFLDDYKKRVMIILIVSTIGSILTILKIAPYPHFRYYAFIYPFVFVVLSMLLDFITGKESVGRYMAYGLFILCIIANISSQFFIQPQFLYSGYKEVIESVNNEEKPVCIYIYSKGMAYAVVEFEDLFGHMDRTYIMERESYAQHIDELKDCLADNEEIYLLLDSEAIETGVKDALAKEINVSSIEEIFGFESKGMGSRGRLYTISN